MKIKKNIIYLFLVIYFFLGAYQSINTGISFDEYHENLNWKTNLSGIKEIFENKTNKILLNYEDKYHGIGFNWISNPIQILIYKSLSNYLNINDYGSLLIAKHPVVFITFFISGIFFYLICNLVIRNNNFSFISTSIYLLHPYLFGHSFFNSKDIPFLSLWVICTYLIIKFIKNLVDSKLITKKFILIFSLATALLISIRIVGLIIFLQYLIFILAFIENKNYNLLIFFRKKLNIFILFLFFTFFFVYIFNPIFWLNPLEIINSIQWMGKYYHDICTLTLGECMPALNLPSSYYFIWFFFKLPIIVLLGLIFFPFVEKKIFGDNFIKIIIISLLFTVFSILILFILKNVSLYDEIRHIMFLIPLIMLIAFINIFL